jgi:hypothetical protein
VSKKYRTRRWASEEVGRFSRQVLGPGVGDGISECELKDGYHSLLANRHAAARLFETEAPRLMDRLLLRLDDLARELALAVIERDGPYIAAVGELSWLVAQSDYCYAACQLSGRRKQYVLAQPALTYFRNLDRRPLPVRVLRLESPFESLRRVNLHQAERVTLSPGDSLLVNGFERLIWFEESGVVLGSVSTLPLGAYEATFDATTGDRTGLFSTEMRFSSIEVVLRALAAGGWGGAMDIASDAARHPVRELRWSALNYAWRTDPGDLTDRLTLFAGDADPQIAQTAQQCLAQLQSEGTA